MKVELSIKDDSELRNMVKDMIQGQVKSVAREEIRSIIAEQLVSKGGDEMGDEIFKAVKAEIRQDIRIALGGSHGFVSVARGLLGDLLREELQRAREGHFGDILGKG